MNSPKPKRPTPKLRKQREVAEVVSQPQRSKRSFVLPKTNGSHAGRSRPEFSEEVLEWLEEEDYL